MAVRNFWLENALGAKYQLRTESVFFNAPMGLGYGVDITTLRLGNSNLITSEEYNLGSVTGEVFFLDRRETAYQRYLEFAQFLYERPITLHYTPPNTQESYSCQVRVTSVEKGDMGADHILRIPITMYRQTMWYSDTEHTIEAMNVSLEGKMYPLARPYHYGLISINNVPLFNAGVAEAPLKIEIDGEVTDPQVSIYDNNNVRYGVAKLLGSYDYVMINSDELNEEIVLERDGSAIANAVNYQDLSVGDPRKVYVTFLKLRPGRSSLVFSVGGEFSGKTRVTWRNTYVTV